MKAITLLLAEDHHIVREGLRVLLEKDPDFRIVGEAGDGHQAIQMALKLKPDIIILDIAMPLLNGMEVIRQILKEPGKTRVLVLSAHSDDNYVDRVVALGASGYLIKQSASQVLAKAIRKVADGGIYFSPSIAQRRNQKARKNELMGAGKERNNNMETLTPREAEVLQLIAEGKANKQTADTLGISIKTVEKHRQNLMEKLNIHDTAGLTRHAIATGVVENSVQNTTAICSRK